MFELSLTPFALTAYIATVVVMALTPGPDMVLYLGKAISQSRRAGLVTFAGAASGLLVHTTFAAIGLSALFAASATAFTVVKIVGALYLLYLAVDALRRGTAFALDASSASEAMGSLFAKGFLVNLLNPKIVVFFVTLLPQFVDVDAVNPTQTLIVLGVGFIVIAAPMCEHAPKELGPNDNLGVAAAGQFFENNFRLIINFLSHKRLADAKFRFGGERCARVTIDDGCVLAARYVVTLRPIKVLGQEILDLGLQ